MPVSAYATRPPARRGFGTARQGAAGRASSQQTSRILELQRTAGNRAVTAALASVQREVDKNKPDVITGADKAAPRRTTGFLGLNPGADIEATKLKKTSREDILTSFNDPAAEKKLKEDPAAFDFVVDELGIDVVDFARWDKATDILLKGDKNVREQLADLMRWFNKAEKGEITLDRLVLSGHSNGVELWGESQQGQESQPGQVVIERDLRAIAEVFPKGAGQVEDIMFSACFSITAVELVVKVFPNLKNAWSYSTFSPDAKQGSAEHIAEFARATEGSGSLTRSNRRGSSALWTKQKGYIVGDPNLAAAGPLYTEAVRKYREIAEPMYKGDGPDLTNDQLLPAYTASHQMLQHTGTSEEHRQKGRYVMQIILRLRFWPKIRERFGVEYKSQLQPAYDALGMPQPDWSTITRKALKAHIEAVKKALEAKPDAKVHKVLLEKYLDNGILGLAEKEIIKADWI